MSRRPGPVAHLQADQLVACVDGPLAPQWWHLAEWRELVESTKRAATPYDPPIHGAAARYSRPLRGDVVAHPHIDGVAGMAVRYQEGT